MTRLTRTAMAALIISMTTLQTIPAHAEPSHQQQAAASNSLVSNIMKTKHETSKAIAQNLR